MPTDLKITELQVASSLTGDDIGILVKNDTDYQFTFQKLLQFVVTNLPIESFGSSITFVRSIPQNNLGKNGDVAISTPNQTFYQKIEGSWIQCYQIAASSANTGSSNAILYGIENIEPNAGNIGDTYINTRTGVFYKKSDKGWAQVFSMLSGPAGGPGPKGDTGAPGANGKTILHGESNPSNLAVGTDGDFYINTTYYTLFGPKTNGDWGQGIPITDNIDLINQLSEAIGDLTDLNTEAHTNLVSAINEVSAANKPAVFPEAFVVSLPNDPLGLNGYQVSKDDTIAAFLKKAFRKAKPASYIQPSASMTTSYTTTNIEIGTIIPSLTLRGVFNKGDAGDIISERILKNNAALAQAGTATDLNVQITDSETVYQYEVKYAQGDVKPDSFNDPDPTNQIPAGTKTYTVTFKGYRYLFTSFDTSTLVKKVIDPKDGTTFDLSIPAGSQRVRIIYPAYLRDFTRANGSKALYVEDSNKDITGNFTMSAQIQQPGASGYQPIAYKVAEFVPVEPFPSSVTYKITI
ncbi:hypothetical protein KHS38_09645 [Mucilaginibacter sp. Bleaf8]|uniref:hypothetical protein n=1 Tax=Mucilaginibacter sp. Bleaf8 TaxID=2834430 RepID=UPI001BCE3EB4|nr:hypothetical protein [Mucilaginibacter sp. Bleaf8]MBS7564666.1 hypothetical protein [Mucilaginibacter sp. Bleaf8]